MLALPCHADVKARRKKRDKPKSGTVLPQEELQTVPPMQAASEQERRVQSRYERLLIKYLANIDRLRRERRESAIREYQERLRRFQTQAEQLQKRKDQVLADLRKEAQTRPRKKIDFEGECYENKGGILVPVSDASARIFARLYRSNVLEVENMMQAVSWHAQILSGGWLDLIEEVRKDAEEDSALWRACVRTLYRAGVSRETYGPILRRLALEHDGVAALEALLFDIDTDSGELKKVVTKENLELLDSLSDEERPPGIRVTCAHYALELRDYRLAHRICTDLLGRRYKGEGTSSRRTLPEDFPLARARHAAMVLMFSGFRNRAGFKAVYDHSQIETTELIQHQGDIGGSTGWVSFTSYIAGYMEVQKARSLIATLD